MNSLQQIGCVYDRDVSESRESGPTDQVMLSGF
jgi:hypothetical protein